MNKKERFASEVLLFVTLSGVAIVMTSLAVVLMASMVAEVIDGVSK